MRTKVLLLMLATSFAALPALAVDPVNTGLFGNTAIKGYDPVAYFDGGPAKGSKKFVHAWQGAEWRFSSAENRDRFAGDPESFAPQFGGYCAWAVAQGDTAGIDPLAWKVENGKLYLNYNKKIQKKWAEDIPGNIAKAEKNWPSLLDG
ncbi:MAG: YHS domain-containing (seleno)protein [Acidobacteriota bacterium]